MNNFHRHSDIAFINFICVNRQLLMGGSIILILLYHAFCWIPPEKENYFKVFKYGYIGVDIFLYLSGFGLCYSYTKQSILNFYIRRIIRIFPLYIISGTILSSIFIILGEHISAWDFFCNISTLSYYHVGGTYWNWYIPAIVLLYFLFPLFIILYKKYGTVLYVITNMAVIISIGCFSIPWQYECLITRIPIFALGILSFLYRSDKYTLNILFFLTFTLFVITCSYNLSVFYQTATFCPLLLILTFHFNNVIKYPKLCDFFGRHTFEFFLGNSISYYFVHIVARHTQQHIVFYITYWGATTILASILIVINNFLLRKTHFND